MTVPANYRVVTALLIVLILGWSSAHAAPRTSDASAAQCNALMSLDLSNLMDAPTQIMNANVVESVNEVPRFCEVEGYVAPNVGFKMALPLSDWNGKFLEIGCGGYCGEMQRSFAQCASALRKGYSCVVSDMGHTSTGFDAKWAYGNLQAEVDFGYRATHVTALAGKAITHQLYAEPAQKSYYMGCSTGGRQGMVEAQRFPWDFDGIVAGSVNIDMQAELTALLWDARAMRGPDGAFVLDDASLRRVHEAAIAKCDVDDGIKDGIIGNPRACSFDPAELACSAHKAGACLNAIQVEAVRKIYRGPQTSTGFKLSVGGSMPGSELSWIDWMLPSDLSRLYSPTESMTDLFVRDWFRYLAFMPDAGPSWKMSDFDFDRDYKRFMLMESLYSNSNPDLRKFKSAGGKLLVYGGWSDPDATPGGIIDYYETAEKVIGSRDETQKFFRLFMVPGMSHCGAGDGPFAIDYLHYLERWVELGQPPDLLIGTGSHRQIFSTQAAEPRKPGVEASTRPVYPYPLWTRYKGAGNSNDWKSYEPVKPQPPVQHR